MPPGRLDVKVLSARDIKRAQNDGAQKLYFLASLGDKHFESPAATDGEETSKWDTPFSFNVQDETNLQLKLKNRNDHTSDELLGNAEYSLTKVFSEGKDDSTISVITETGSAQGTLHIITAFYSAESIESGDPASHSESRSLGLAGQNLLYANLPPTASSMQGFSLAMQQSTQKMSTNPYSTGYQSMPSQGGQPTPLLYQPPAAHSQPLYNSPAQLSPGYLPGQQTVPQQPQIGYATAYQQPPAQYQQGTGYPMSQQASAGYPQQQQPIQYSQSYPVQQPQQRPPYMPQNQPYPQIQTVSYVPQQAGMPPEIYPVQPRPQITLGGHAHQIAAPGTVYLPTVPGAMYYGPSHHVGKFKKHKKYKRHKRGWFGFKRRKKWF